LLREDPLSPVIFDMFLRKYPYHVSLFIREFIYLKVAHFFNSINSNNPS
jgi:hypothetical protein